MEKNEDISGLLLTVFSQKLARIVELQTANHLVMSGLMQHALCLQRVQNAERPQEELKGIIGKRLLILHPKPVLFVEKQRGVC